MKANALDVPVPRELISKVVPESTAPNIEVVDLSGNRVVGSLERVSSEDISRLTQGLTEKGYKWHVIECGDGLNEILYFNSIENPSSTKAMQLRTRDLGLEEPPLTINEHLELGALFGVPQEELHVFKLETLRLLVKEGLAESQVDLPKGRRTLRVTNPEFKSTSLEWARCHADQGKFGISEGTATAMHVDVWPLGEKDFEELKKYLDSLGVEYEEVHGEDGLEGVMVSPDGMKKLRGASERRLEERDTSVSVERETLSDGTTLVHVLFGRGGIDGQAILQPKDVTAIDTLNIGGVTRFRDEQHITWEVERVEDSYANIKSVGLEGLHGMIPWPVGSEQRVREQGGSTEEGRIHRQAMNIIRHYSGSREEWIEDIEGFGSLEDQHEEIARRVGLQLPHLGLATWDAVVAEIERITRGGQGESKTEQDDYEDALKREICDMEDLIRKTYTTPEDRQTAEYDARVRDLNRKRKELRQWKSSQRHDLESKTGDVVNWLLKEGESKQRVREQVGYFSLDLSVPDEEAVQASRAMSDVGLEFEDEGIGGRTVFSFHTQDDRDAARELLDAAGITCVVESTRSTVDDELRNLTMGYYAVVEVDDPDNQNPVRVLAVRRDYDAAVEAIGRAVKHGGVDRTVLMQQTEKGLRHISFVLPESLLTENPYEIQQDGDKWKVVNKETGKVHGTHSSKAKAKKHLAALYANVKEARHIEPERMLAIPEGDSLQAFRVLGDAGFEFKDEGSKDGHTIIWFHSPEDLESAKRLLDDHGLSYRVEEQVGEVVGEDNLKESRCPKCGGPLRPTPGDPDEWCCADCGMCFRRSELSDYGVTNIGREPREEDLDTRRVWGSDVHVGDKVMVRDLYYGSGGHLPGVVTDVVLAGQSDVPGDAQPVTLLRIDIDQVEADLYGIGNPMEIEEPFKSTEQVGGLLTVESKVEEELSVQKRWVRMLRKAGCKCPDPLLLGYRADESGKITSVKCRICNTEVPVTTNMKFSAGLDRPVRGYHKQEARREPSNTVRCQACDEQVVPDEHGRCPNCGFVIPTSERSGISRSALSSWAKGLPWYERVVGLLDQYSRAKEAGEPVEELRAKLMDLGVANPDEVLGEEGGSTTEVEQQKQGTCPRCGSSSLMDVNDPEEGTIIRCNDCYYQGGVEEFYQPDNGEPTTESRFSVLTKDITPTIPPDDALTNLEVIAKELGGRVTGHSVGWIEFLVPSDKAEEFRSRVRKLGGKAYLKLRPAQYAPEEESIEGAVDQILKEKTDVKTPHGDWYSFTTPECEEFLREVDSAGIEAAAAYLRHVRRLLPTHEAPTVAQALLAKLRPHTRDQGRQVQGGYPQPGYPLGGQGW